MVGVSGFEAQLLSLGHSRPFDAAERLTLSEIGLGAPKPVTSMNKRIRVLGLTAEPPFGAGEFAKTAALYPALGRRFNIVSLLRPTVPRGDRILSRLVRVHPAVRSASGRFGFHS